MRNLGIRYHELLTQFNRGMIASPGILVKEYGAELAPQMPARRCVLPCFSSATYRLLVLKDVLRAVA